MYEINRISGQVVDAAMEVHRELGPGLLESIYETALAYELTQRGWNLQRQVAIAAQYKDVCFDCGFRADLIVENQVLVELKSVEKLAPVHSKQVLTYLKLTGLQVGLLLNFNEALLKDGLVRLVHNL